MGPSNQGHQEVSSTGYIKGLDSTVEVSLAPAVLPLTSPKQHLSDIDSLIFS